MLVLALLGLLFSAALAFVPQRGLPVFLHTQGGGPSVLVASIATGEARVPALYALLATGGTHVAVAGPVAPEIMLWIGGEPRVFDALPLAAPVPGCAICKGVVPIGKGSPFWNPYSTATLTGDAILFDEARLTRRAAAVPCVWALDGLCDVPALLQGEPTTLRLDFSRPETRIPAAIFYEYLDDKHPLTTRAGDWDDLEIAVAGGPTIRVPGRGAVSAHLGFPHQFFIAPHADNLVLAGADLLRYTSVYWDIAAGTVAFEPRVSARGYSWYSALLIVACVAAWYHLRDLHRPGRPTLAICLASVLVAAGVGVLSGRVLLADVVLLVLAAAVYGSASLALLGALVVQTRRGTVPWLWLDHIRTSLALTNVFLATFLLALEPRIYYYSTLPSAVVALTWLYTTYEHWTLIVRDTRRAPRPVYVVSWVVGALWAAALTVALHTWVFVPAMLGFVPGGGARVTLGLLCVYAALALGASFVVRQKHRQNKQYHYKPHK
jgi:hypothetical protein